MLCSTFNIGHGHGPIPNWMNNIAKSFCSDYPLCVVAFGNQVSFVLLSVENHSNNCMFCIPFARHLFYVQKLTSLNQIPTNLALERITYTYMYNVYCTLYVLWVWSLFVILNHDSVHKRFTPTSETDNYYRATQKMYEVIQFESNN